MKPWVQLCRQIAWTLGSWIFSFALWGCWLVLAIAIAAQVYILSSRELALPGFVLRQIEAQLAESGVRATFGRTSFDPAGRILIENVRLSLPAFAEPVLTARSVFVRVSPWPLLVGRIEPGELRLTGVTAAVPAMLSPTGRSEEVLRDFDLTLEPARRAFTIRQFTGRIANLTLTAHGPLVLTAPTVGKSPADVLADFIAHRFPVLCREALALEERLAQFEAPAMHLEFSPSESGAATIDVRAFARGMRLAEPVAVEAEHLRVRTRILLFGETPPYHIDISARQVRLPSDTLVRGLQARILGRFKREVGGFDLREVLLTADSIAAAGIDARAISAQVFPRTLPTVEMSAVATLLGAPLALQAEADLRARSATVQFRGGISPAILGVLSKRFGTDVRRFFDFETLFVERGEARFGAQLAFERLEARLVVPRSIAYGVPLADGRTTVTLEPGRFHAPEAFARIGTNFARGSYEHDLKTTRYRFLLAGQLRPLDISGWFRDWWPNFFGQFEFPVVPPEASVEVAGAWRAGGQSTVFVFADSDRPIVRGAALDRVRTQLFIRPGFVDGLEILATRGDGETQGAFTYRAHPVTQAWETLDVELASTLDLKLVTQILGPMGAKMLAPFQLAHPPEVKVRGQFAGPAAAGGANAKLRIDGRTAGDFHFYQFPLQDVSFTAKLDRDEIVLDDITGTFAGGAVMGHARVWGAGAARRLGFDLTLNDASLGQAAAGLGEFLAAQKKQPPPPPGKFIQQKANVRLNLAASAEGGYTDTNSYRGSGSTTLRGAGLGEVPLLGSLSELLKFTALRFTEALGNFKIEGPRLVFTEIALRGANSAIDARGSYALDRQELDFAAKLFPFQESEGLIKSVVGAVLTPLSSAFEVKLTGTMAKPEWSFVMGPTNFFRSLAAPAEEKAAPPAPVPAPMP